MSSEDILQPSVKRKKFLSIIFQYIFVWLVLNCQVEGRSQFKHRQIPQRDSSEFTNFEVLDNGRYVVQWSVDLEQRQITFETTVMTRGYVGFGLSSRGKGMLGGDFVLGGVFSNGSTYFTDRHGRGNQEPTIDQSQDWQLLGAEENSTHTTLRFSRALDTCDRDDYQLSDDTVFLLWSYGRSDNPSQYHVGSRGQYPVHLLDPNFIPKDLKAASFNAGLIPKSVLAQNQLRVWTISTRLRVPKHDTTYFCTVHQAPRLKRKHHIVGFRTRLETQQALQHTQHLVLYRCTAPPMSDPEQVWTPFVNSTGTECYFLNRQNGEIPTQYCTEITYTFGAGGRMMMYPDHIGQPFGEMPEEYYLLQTHYDNPARRHDIKYDIHIDVFYTDRLRPNELGIMSFGQQVPGNPSILIPPNSPNHEIFSHCGGECTEKMFPREGINIFQVALHTHYAGRRLRLRQIRREQELPWIVNDENYDSLYQGYRVLNQEVNVRRGDHIILRCAYDNTWINGTVVGGFSTRQETCLAYVYFYNRLKEEFATCRSEITDVYYPRRYLGVSNTTWDNYKLDVVATLPPRLANRTLASISDEIQWNRELRREIQEDHRSLPQVSSCPRTDAVSVASQGQADAPADDESFVVRYPSEAVEYRPPDRICTTGQIAKAQIGATRNNQRGNSAAGGVDNSSEEVVIDRVSRNRNKRPKHNLNLQGNGRVSLYENYKSINDSSEYNSLLDDVRTTSFNRDWETTSQQPLDDGRAALYPNVGATPSNMLNSGREISSQSPTFRTTSNRLNSDNPNIGGVTQPSRLDRNREISSQSPSFRTLGGSGIRTTENPTLGGTGVSLAQFNSARRDPELSSQRPLSGGGVTRLSGNNDRAGGTLTTGYLRETSTSAQAPRTPVSGLARNRGSPQPNVAFNFNDNQAQSLRENDQPPTAPDRNSNNRGSQPNVAFNFNDNSAQRLGNDPSRRVPVTGPARNTNNRLSQANIALNFNDDSAQRPGNDQPPRVSPTGTAGNTNNRLSQANIAFNFNDESAQRLGNDQLPRAPPTAPARNTNIRGSQPTVAFNFDDNSAQRLGSDQRPRVPPTGPAGNTNNNRGSQANVAFDFNDNSAQSLAPPPRVPPTGPARNTNNRGSQPNDAFNFNDNSSQRLANDQLPRIPPTGPARNTNNRGSQPTVAFNFNDNSAQSLAPPPRVPPTGPARNTNTRGSQPSITFNFNGNTAQSIGGSIEPPRMPPAGPTRNTNNRGAQPNVVFNLNDNSAQSLGNDRPPRIRITVPARNNNNRGSQPTIAFNFNDNSAQSLGGNSNRLSGQNLNNNLNIQPQTGPRAGAGGNSNRQSSSPRPGTGQTSNRQSSPRPVTNVYNVGTGNRQSSPRPNTNSNAAIQTGRGTFNRLGGSTPNYAINNQGTFTVLGASKPTIFREVVSPPSSNTGTLNRLAGTTPRSRNRTQTVTYSPVDDGGRTETYSTDDGEGNTGVTQPYSPRTQTRPRPTLSNGLNVNTLSGNSDPLVTAFYRETSTSAQQPPSSSRRPLSSNPPNQGNFTTPFSCCTGNTTLPPPATTIQPGNNNFVDPNSVFGREIPINGRIRITMNVLFDDHKGNLFSLRPPVITSRPRTSSNNRNRNPNIDNNRPIPLNPAIPHHPGDTGSDISVTVPNNEITPIPSPVKKGRNRNRNRNKTPVIDLSEITRQVPPQTVVTPANNLNQDNIGQLRPFDGGERGIEQPLTGTIGDEQNVATPLPPRYVTTSPLGNTDSVNPGTVTPGLNDGVTPNPVIFLGGSLATQAPQSKRKPQKSSTPRPPVKSIPQNEVVINSIDFGNLGLTQVGIGQPNLGLNVGNHVTFERDYGPGPVTVLGDDHRQNQIDISNPSVDLKTTVVNQQGNLLGTISLNPGAHLDSQYILQNYPFVGNSLGHQIHIVGVPPTTPDDIGGKHSIIHYGDTLTNQLTDFTVGSQDGSLNAVKNNNLLTTAYVVGGGSPFSVVNGISTNNFVSGGGSPHAQSVQVQTDSVGVPISQDGDSISFNSREDDNKDTENHGENANSVSDQQQVEGEYVEEKDGGGWDWKREQESQHEK